MTKTLPPRILVNVVPNPLCRCYHVNARLNDGYVEHFNFPLRVSSEKSIEKVGPVGGEVARKLNDVLGITGVSFSIYHIQVLIGDAFSWDDGIHDTIVEAMKGVFGKTQDEVKVEMNDTRHLYSRSSMEYDFDFPSPRRPMSTMRDIDEALNAHEHDGDGEGMGERDTDTEVGGEQASVEPAEATTETEPKTVN